MSGNPSRLYPALNERDQGPPPYFPATPAYHHGTPHVFPASPAQVHGRPHVFPAMPAEHHPYGGPACFPATPATHVGHGFPSAPAMNHGRAPYPAVDAKDYDYGWIPPSHCIGTHTWVPSSGGHVPPDAVHGGMDKDGGPIYIGRAFHEGDLLPAKICPTHGCAFVCFNGQEVTKMHYEVLCSNHVAWKFARNGEYPPEAIRVGTTSIGEPLFVGRTMIEGTMTPGKVHPSHNCLYIPYDGKEISVPEYEILILN